MNREYLIKMHAAKRTDIRKRLRDFSNTDGKKEIFNELLFCLLTPQSNAKKCWFAVEEISKLKKWNKKNISSILSKNTRFHNNKTNYVLEAEYSWNDIKDKLNEEDITELRNFISENVKGYGLKEASHFLRNIGKSNNKIAILDRHILRNLKDLEIIDNEKIKNGKHYLEIEKKFIDFSNDINIPIDELDLLFWSEESGEIFK